MGTGISFARGGGVNFSHQTHAVGLGFCREKNSQISCLKGATSHQSNKEDTVRL
jgi:hypothetical protein